MTHVNDFYIQIENSAGVPYGSGPITEASYWEYTARLDRAGSFSFQIPATVEKAALVQNERIARARALVGGVWVDVGAGPISDVTRTKGDDGKVMLVVKGDDLLRELTYPSVHNLLLDDIPVMPLSDAVVVLQAYAPSGWAFTLLDSAINDAVYLRFNGESLLGAVLRVTQSQTMHFYRDPSGTGRELVIARVFVSSGIRAIQAQGPLAAETCAITSISQHQVSSDFYTAIYPHGSGNGDIDLRLTYTDRVAPAGYTLTAASNKLSNNANVIAYGLRERHVDFKDIGPVSNTAADLLAASNALYDVALRELQLVSARIDEATYDVTLASCSALLRPMQTMQLAYRNADEGLSLDGLTLNILEATWRVEASEIKTTKVVVSTSDGWAQDDVSTIADAITEGHAYRALSQIGPNSYWENGTVYVGDSQTDNVGEMPFIFGPEVMQLQQVVLRYRVTDTISPTKTSIGGSTSSGASLTASSDVTTANPYNHAHALEFNRTAAAPGFAVRLDTALGGTLYVVDGGAGTYTGGATGLTNLNSHTHGIQHTHSFVPILTTTFGLFKSTATYALGELEIRITSGSTTGWINLNTGVSKGGSYYELDLTTYVSNADFTPAAENNLIEIRRTLAAGTGKTATIYLKLGVRDKVQAILYS